MPTITTNAALATYHAAQAAKFAALARRDAGTPVTEDNMDYLAAANKAASTSSNPEPDVLDFLDDAPPKVVQVPVSAIDVAELENLLAMAGEVCRANGSNVALRRANLLDQVSAAEERLGAVRVAALPAKAKPAAGAAKKPLKPAPAAEAPEGGPRTEPTARQVRVLSLLAGAKGPLNKAAVMAGANIGAGWVSEVAGHSDPAKRAHHDEKWGTTLVTLGLVKVKILPTADGQRQEQAWEITAAGRKYLAKLGA